MIQNYSVIILEMFKLSKLSFIFHQGVCFLSYPFMSVLHVKLYISIVSLRGHHHATCTLLVHLKEVQFKGGANSSLAALSGTYNVLLDAKPSTDTKKILIFIQLSKMLDLQPCVDDEWRCLEEWRH